MHIVFTGGGSLGPVTPLMAIMSEIRRVRPDAEFSWIGTKDGVESRVVAEAGIPFHAVAAGKFRRYFSWQTLMEPFVVLMGFFQARALLKASHASAVVSAGGFVAPPVAWAAKTLGIPVHVHQQDVIPGLANRLTLPVASSLSVALEKSVADFPGKQAVWTGNPVRPEVLAGSVAAAMETFGLEAGVPVVLVTGGGTGAAGLNALVRQSLPLLTVTAQVMHVTGVGKSDPSVTHPRYHQFELLTKEMPHALAAADVVVTRAGMGSLTELAALGKPTIIVPMPHSHQEANARAFAAGGAELLDQESASPDSFSAAVLGVLEDDGKRANMGKAMAAMHRSDAAARVAAMVIGLADGASKGVRS